MGKYLKKFAVIAGLHAGLALAGGALAEGEPPASEPLVRQPDSLQWQSPPWDPRVAATWIIGAERESGPYLQRVRIAPGGSIPRHWHPDTRQTTVLSGTLHVSFGAEDEEKREVLLPAGAVYVVPAHLPHEVRPEGGEVTYQEAGTGPTATNLLKN